MEIGFFRNGICVTAVLHLSWVKLPGLFWYLFDVTNLPTDDTDLPGTVGHHKYCDCPLMSNMCAILDHSMLDVSISVTPWVSTDLVHINHCRWHHTAVYIGGCCYYHYNYAEYFDTTICISRCLCVFRPSINNVYIGGIMTAYCCLYVVGKNFLYIYCIYYDGCEGLCLISHGCNDVLLNHDVLTNFPSDFHSDSRTANCIVDGNATICLLIPINPFVRELLAAPLLAQI